MLRHSNAAVLLAALVALGPLDGTAQETIEILEPAAWRSDATRGIGVRQRRGLRVMGIARSNAGVDRVTLNGAEAALTGTSGGVQFTGYVTATPDTPEVRVDV